MDPATKRARVGRNPFLYGPLVVVEFFDYKNSIAFSLVCKGLRQRLKGTVLTVDDKAFTTDQAFHDVLVQGYWAFTHWPIFLDPSTIPQPLVERVVTLHHYDDFPTRGGQEDYKPFVRLTSLEVAATAIDVARLPLPSLRHLSLSHCDIKNADALRDLPCLEKLAISGLAKACRTLELPSSLRELTLHNTVILSMSVLDHLSSLHVLNLRGVSLIYEADVEGAGQFWAQLEELVLDVGPIMYAARLAECTRLRKARLSHISQIDLSGSVACLEFLALDQCCIASASATWLPRCPNLAHIDLVKCRGYGGTNNFASVVSALPNLRVLSIGMHSSWTERLTHPIWSPSLVELCLDFSSTRQVPHEIVLHDRLPSLAVLALLGPLEPWHYLQNSWPPSLRELVVSQQIAPEVLAAPPGLKVTYRASPKVCPCAPIRLVREPPTQSRVLTKPGRRLFREFDDDYDD